MIVVTVYPPDSVGEDYDDGTMPDNVDELRQAVVGRRIVKAEKEKINSRYYQNNVGLVLTLDDGRRVILEDTDDCCAYTELESFLLNPELVDHAITGVATTDGYETWHIFADMGDVLKLKVGWSAGNPFYYSYGFFIRVVDAGDSILED